MAKVLRCKDAGVDCDFVARGKTEEEIIQKALQHAKKDHGMATIPADLMAKVRSMIKEE